MGNSIYDDRGFCRKCHFLKNKTSCSALEDFYNDSDEDKSKHNCLGCVFYKTTKQYTADREKAAERLRQLKLKREEDLYG